MRRMLDNYLPIPGEQRQDWMLWVELWLRAIRHPELAPTSARLYADMHEWVRETIAADAIAAGRDPDDLRRPPAGADRRLRGAGDDAIRMDLSGWELSGPHRKLDAAPPVSGGGA